jgi:thiol-disulfide isomerase/thioredoxin
MNIKYIFLTLFFVLTSNNILLPLNTGEKSPAIMIKASNGDMFNPAKTGKDKQIILSFFSDNCTPCLKEIAELQKLQENYKDIIIYLVADVNTDEKKAKKFLKKIESSSDVEITLPVVYDIYSDIKNAFKVKQFPTLFLIDKNGIIRLIFDGYTSANIESLKKKVNNL